MSNYRPVGQLTSQNGCWLFLTGPPENYCQNYVVVPPALAEHAETGFTSSETLKLQHYFLFSHL